MELDIIKSLQHSGSAFFDGFCEVISYFAGYFGFILVFLIIFTFINKKFSIFFGLTYGISVACNYILKAMVDRPRPYEVDSTIVNKLPAVGASFPSGHALSSTIIICFLLFIIWFAFKNKTVKIVLSCLLFGLLILVIISRMYLGQHFLIDTIAGVFLGLIFSFIGIGSYIRNISKMEERYGRKGNNFKKTK
jgi:membrane-associated phospholipid phosphatase